MLRLTQMPLPGLTSCNSLLQLSVKAGELLFLKPLLKPKRVEKQKKEQREAKETNRAKKLLKKQKQSLLLPKMIWMIFSVMMAVMVELLLLQR